MSYTIGQVAKETGLSIHAIRYYEKEGILPHVSRDEKGIRIFSEEDQFWLSVINCLRATNMSIADIKNIVDLSLEGDHTLSQRKVILKEHKEKIAKQMDDLKLAMDKIDQKISFYESADSHCLSYNNKDEK